MELPARRTPIDRCDSLARYTVKALRQYPETFTTSPETAARLRALATTLDGARAALMGSQSEYRGLIALLIDARVEVKLIDLRADEVVRSVKRSADEAGASIAASVFPAGVTPIVKPVGETQASEMRSLEARIDAASSWPEREAQKQRIVQERTRYEAALTRRREALRAASDKRATRDTIKEDFLDVFASVAGALKELFPRDRIRQDVFFDAVRAPSGSGEAAEDDEPSPAPA